MKRKMMLSALVGLSLVCAGSPRIGDQTARAGDFVKQAKKQMTLSPGQTQGVAQSNRKNMHAALKYGQKTCQQNGGTFSRTQFVKVPGLVGAQTTASCN